MPPGCLPDASRDASHASRTCHPRCPRRESNPGGCHLRDRLRCQFVAALAEAFPEPAPDELVRVFGPEADTAAASLAQALAGAVVSLDPGDPDDREALAWLGAA
jgi:hypothetical protein